MSTPLDPAIAQIIPLLPLRDPDTMTPQSARDALRALVAARADIPLPQVQTIDEMEVTGAEVRPSCARLSRLSAEIADRHLIPRRRLGRRRPRNA